MLLIALVAAIYFGYHRFHDRTEPSPSLARQIATLTHTQNDLTRLLSFVDSQKVELRSREQVVADLRRQAAELKLVVEADQKVVQAVLAAEARNRATGAWFDRALSFGVGVLSSMFATWLLSFLRQRGQPPASIEPPDDGVKK
ncbi:MAG: hypothetical protein M3Z54_11140 [Gemmatimonadota bacterium]|nr:hypothetical protein [Gemmatimonadota bacterium]